MAYAVWDTLTDPMSNPRATLHTAAYSGPGYLSMITDGGKKWSTPRVIFPTATTAAAKSRVAVGQGRMMTGAGPLDLAGAVQTVALILDGRPVRVIGMAGRPAYPHESTCAAVTVSVHLDTAHDVDHVGELLALGLDLVPGRGLHSRSGDWQDGVHISLYGPARLVAAVAS